MPQARQFTNFWRCAVLDDFPLNVRAKVKQILDREARRLLADEANGDAIGTPPGRRDDSALDGRPDQLAPSV